MYSRFIMIAAVLAGMFTAVESAAQQTYTLDNGAVISNVSVDRQGRELEVSMDVDLSDVRVASNSSVSIAPVIVAGSDTLKLNALTIYGRQNRLYNIRNDRPLVSRPEDRAWLKSKAPSEYKYQATAQYSSWMDGAVLKVNDCTLGCCNKVLADNWTDTGAGYSLPRIPEYVPEFVYMRPGAVVNKLRSLEATSYVDFPVNKTGIYPQYRNNPKELARIVATIDSVKNDSDVTIRKITLKGFASPESPYSNNKRLAEGRTESVKHYVAALSNIPERVFATDFEPENWEGLRAYVQNSRIDNKSGILSIIDETATEPDAREKKLKTTYPDEYAYLYENCYPALRKVDYRIDYEVRSFKGVEEIRAAYRKNPQNLSLEEFYVLAQSYDESDSEYHEILKQAVRCYPSDKVANLNAALVSMSEGRIQDAGDFLDKAGDGAEAIYARGVYNALIKNYDTALKMFNLVENRIPQAAAAAESVRNIITITELVENR